MPKLKYSVAIPVKDYADALKKVQKFVKRGFIADTAWNTGTTVRNLAQYYVVVFKGCNSVSIQSHQGYGVKTILDHVRDVEKYYV